MLSTKRLHGGHNMSSLALFIVLLISVLVIICVIWKDPCFVKDPSNRISEIWTVCVLAGIFTWIFHTHEYSIKLIVAFGALLIMVICLLCSLWHKLKSINKSVGLDKLRHIHKRERERIRQGRRLFVRGQRS